MLEIGIKGRQKTTVTTVNHCHERELISEGTHERFIIDIEKFQSKSENK